MRLLDLFCGAGGASVGYSRAGFDVVGVDIKPQPRYPFEFHQVDALMIMADLLDGWPTSGFAAGDVLADFDAIHASPPCQRWSDLAKRNGNAHEWPDLIAPTRALLERSGLPYVIENVEGAPLIDAVMLCGVSYPPLRVLRHRLFESNVPLFPPPHQRHPLVYTRDKRKAHYGRLDDRTAFVTVTGGGNSSVAAARDAMGIDWMTKDELNEAIPPAYTEWVGRNIMQAIFEVSV